MIDGERWLDDLLLMALDDWVHIGDVVGAAMRASNDPQVVRSVALGLGTQALVADELVAGDLWGTFVPWQLSMPEALDRLIREWLAAGWNPMPGQVCWFAITATGRAAAERALTRRAAAPAGSAPAECAPWPGDPVGPSPFLDQLLQSCRSGRTVLRDAVAIAAAATDDPSVVRDLTLGILAEGLVPGTILAGADGSGSSDGSDGSAETPGFQRWPGTGADALCRIVASWPPTQIEPPPSSRCVLTIG